MDRAELDRAYAAWIELITNTHHATNNRVNSEPSFTPLAKPLAESKVALVTTAGVHLDDQEPFHTETVAGDASVRIIPDDVDLARIRFSHTHYDTSPAEADPNVVLPIDRLHEFVEEGRVGSSSPVHIGMMGFNPDPTAMADETAPHVAGLLSEAGVDVAVMVPG